MDRPLAYGFEVLHLNGGLGVQLCFCFSRSISFDQKGTSSRLWKQDQLTKGGRGASKAQSKRRDLEHRHPSAVVKSSF
jgi:hypothetical protein